MKDQIAPDIKWATDELQKAIDSMNESIKFVQADCLKDGNRSRVVLRAEIHKLRESCWKVTDGLLNP